jgi:hypothetical protein
MHQPQFVLGVIHHTGWLFGCLAPDGQVSPGVDHASKYATPGDAGAELDRRAEWAESIDCRVEVLGVVRPPPGVVPRRTRGPDVLSW